MPTFKDRQTDLGRTVSPPPGIREEATPEEKEVKQQPQQPARRRVRIGKVIVFMVFLYGFSLALGDIFDFDILTFLSDIVSGR